MLKVVVDTSVFVSGFLSRNRSSNPSMIISRWRDGDFQLVMSRPILEEITATLLEKGIDEKNILEFVTTIGKLALFVPADLIVYRLDNIDPADNKFLSAAQESQADFLVSLDAKHLLPLKHHYRTQILNPKLFIQILDREVSQEEKRIEKEFEAIFHELQNEETQL